MLAFVAFVVAGIVAQFAIWRARPTTLERAGDGDDRAGRHARLLADQADAVCELAGGAAARRVRGTAGAGRLVDRLRPRASARCCC